MVLPKAGSKKHPRFEDLAKGRSGIWLGVEETEDEKWSNIIWRPPGLYSKTKTIYHVPTGSWIFVPYGTPGCSNDMWPGGIFYLLAAEGGESPIASNKLKAEFSALIVAKNQEIERLKSDSVSSKIYARRAVQDMKASLMDHAEIGKITGRSEQQQPQAKGPFLRRPRFEED
jgi:hypothetical protein